jgi:hypothetical protein
LSKLEVVRSYIDTFHQGEGVDQLRNIFAEDLIFNGPLLQTNSSNEYISKLEQDAPRNCSYEILYEFGKREKLTFRFF